MDATRAITAALALLASIGTALAHDGRRFVVRPVDNTLVAVGTIQGDPPVDDGAGIHRDYASALHDHWTNGPTPDVGATATLPGFDLADTGPIAGFPIRLTLLGARRWTNPPVTPPADLHPTLEPLDDDELIALAINGTTITTDAPGTLTLLDPVPADDVEDIDLIYAINQQPADTIYVLDVRLETDAPDIQPSQPIHIILAPDGANPIERLHLATLHLERALGAPLPEPCPCEFDADSDQVDINDLLVFLAGWLVREPTADLNGDAAVTITDLLEFLDCFLSPTPCA